MARINQFQFTVGAALNTSALRYTVAGVCDASQSATESHRQTPYRATAGTASNLYARVTANDAGSTTTMRVRKNGANGNQVLSIAGGATGEFEDVVNTDTVAAGDLIAFEGSRAGFTGTVTYSSLYFLLAATTDTAIRYVTAPAQSLSTDSVTRHSWITGIGDLNATESAVQIKMNLAGSFKNLLVVIESNARTTTTTFRTRINGANGAQSVSVGSGATGIFEDTVNTDTIADEDLVNYSITTGTSGGAIVYRMGVELVTTTRKAQVAAVTARTLVAGSTNFLSIAGQLGVSATESVVTVDANTAFTAFVLHIQATANAAVTASIFRLRKNGSNGNSVVTIPALTTGRFEDITNADYFAANDEIGASLVVGTVGALDVNYVSLICEDRKIRGARNLGDGFAPEVA
jgi:hypothetical protein